MAGKRQRALRRTVSASTMGSGCNIFESSPLLKYSKEKQKLPVLSSYCPHGMLASTNLDGHNPMKASSFKSNPNANAISLTQSEAPSQALPLLHKFNKPPSTLPSSSWNRSERKSVRLGVVAAFSDESRAMTEVKDGKTNPNPNAISLTQSEAPSQALPLLHKFNKPPSTLPSLNRSERKSVGLGVVAAFSDESRAMTEVKDGKNEAPPHVVSKNSINMEPVSFNFPHHSVLMQGRSAVFLHELPCKDDYNDRTSMALPAADFLEACYFCKRRLSHGLDIYMYRGDQAFCSEECRYEQIVLDERKEKCSLQALKMKTSAPSFRSTDQRTQGMTSGTVAAG